MSKFMTLKIDALKEYLIISRIGDGNSSTVYHVQHRTTNQSFALKVFKQKFMTLEEVQNNEEINVMKYIGEHKNIIKLHEIIYEPAKSRLSLVLDLMDNNVYEIIKKRRGPFQVQQTLRLIYQLLNALKHIHSMNIIHRDVKPENCLINPGKMELKLGDFGSSRDVSEGTRPLTEYISTRWYRPPECLLTHGVYDSGIDMWAVGCILYELLTGYPLFPGKSTADQINRIHRILGTPSNDVLKSLCSPNKLKQFEFLQYPKQKLSTILPKAPPEVIDLLSKLLAYLPKDRISAADALNHPAFRITSDKKQFFKHANLNISSAPETDFIGFSNLIRKEQRIKDDECIVQKDIRRRVGFMQLPHVDIPRNQNKISKAEQKHVFLATPPKFTGFGESVLESYYSSSNKISPDKK